MTTRDWKLVHACGLTCIALCVLTSSCGDETDARQTGAGGHDSGNGGTGGAGNAGAASGGSGASAGAGANAGAGGNAGGSDASSGGADTGSGGTGGGSDAGSVGPCAAQTARPMLSAPEPTLSDAELGETFAALDAVLRATPILADRPTDAQAIRAVVQTVPHVGAVGLAADCTVLLLLSDGSPLSIFYDGRSPGVAAAGFARNTASPAPGMAAAAEYYPRAAPISSALPESAAARIGYVENYAATALPHVRSALTKRGYDVKVGMSSADLRTGVNDLGLLWLSTHGMFGCLDFHGNPHYCLAVDALSPTNPACALNSGNAVVDAAQCALNRADFYVSDRASRGQARTGGPVFYSINENWVSAYWSFAKNSLVHLDACDSMSAGASLFRTAAVAKGAGTLLGWAGVVDAAFAETAADFLFDRVLGGDKDNVRPTPQRPFSVEEVLAVMQTRGMITDSGGATLRLERYGAPSSILAPSIQNIMIGDPVVPRVTEKKTGTELTLFGEFGTKPGSVQIGCTDAACTNGTAVTVKTWTANKIVVFIDSGGPGSFGPVNVKVAAGSFSFSGNRVPLTSWRGPARAKVTFSGSYGPPGPFNELTCSALHLRADVHPYRLAPEDTPKAGTFDGQNIEPKVEILNSAADSICGGAIGGSFTNSGIVPATVNGKSQAIAWVEVDARPASPTWSFLFSGKIDTSTSPGRLTLIQEGEICSVAIFHYPPELGGRDEPVDPFCLITEPASFSSQAPVQLGGSYDAVLGTRSAACAGNQCELEYNLVAEPSSAPTSDTEG